MSDPHKNVGLRISSDPDATALTQPGAGAVRREDPLPLRLLLVADLAPNLRPNWRGESLLRRADAHGFAALMEEWQPALRLEVANRLGPQPQTLELALRFTSLRDFSPAGVARQVPALARLLAIRTEVHRVREEGTEREAFRERLAEAGVDAATADGLYGQLTIEPPKPKPAPETDDPLGRLMGMVDTGEEEPADGLASALADDGPRFDRSRADEILEDFDRRLGAQLRAILEHPDVRRLEAAWRGLKFLVERLPSRAPVELDVLPAGREALSEALYYQVLVPEHGGEAERPPLSAVVLGFAFGHGQADVALLEDLAGTGASLQAPLLASASPGFFEADGPEALGRLPFVPQLVEGPAYIPWRKLREAEEARFLALAFPPFLLRAPYGPQNPSKEIPLEEEGHLWGGGALALAAAMLASFAETGWPTHLAGRRIEGLPLYETERGRSPLAALLPEEKAAELAEAGFAVLSGEPDRDAFRLAHTPNLSLVPAFEDAEERAHAAAHATLGCSLFAARVAQRMLALPAELDAEGPLEAKREAVAARLRAFLGLPETEAAVEVEPVPEAEIEGYDLLAVRLQPPRHVLAHPVHLAVGLPVPRVNPA